MKLTQLKDIRKIEKRFAPLPTEMEVVDGNVKSITINGCKITKPYYGDTLDFLVPATREVVSSETVLAGSKVEFQSENESEVADWEDTLRKLFADPGKVVFTRSSKTVPEE